MTMGNPIGRPMNNKRINKSEFNPRIASTSKYGRAMFEIVLMQTSNKICSCNFPEISKVLH